MGLAEFARQTPTISIMIKIHASPVFIIQKAMEEKKYLVAILIIFFIERSETQLQKPVVNVIHLFNCNSLAYIVHTDIKC